MSEFVNAVVESWLSATLRLQALKHRVHNASPYTLSIPAFPSTLSIRPPAQMLRSAVRFADDAAGVEKTLRLLQGFCTLGLGLVHTPEDVEYFLQLRSRFAASRRYFRLLKWHPCWANAHASLSPDSTDSIAMVLAVAKWSVLGMYYFLEMFTITNVVGATSFSWASRVQQEADRCWFYALAFAVLLSLYKLLLPEESPLPPAEDGHTSVVPSQATGSEKKDDRNVSAASVRRTLYSELVIDSCDLFIPGASLGYIPVGPLVVGIASTISTSVAGRQIWIRVQQSSQERK